MDNTMVAHMHLSGVANQPRQSSPVNPDSLRKKAVRIYMALSVSQFALGIGCFVCSGTAVNYDAAVSGVPYYVGGFINGGMLLLSSLLAFRVFNKGPYFDTSEQARKEVICAINWQRVMSFFMFLCCVIGLALIWMYGLCLEHDTECSYVENVHQNKILAIVCFTFGSCGMVTCAIAIIVIRKFGMAFGIVTMATQRGQAFGIRDQATQDWVRQLQQQNEEMQRQLQMQRDPLQYPLGPSQCYTNLGFEPVELPPYSPRADDSSQSGPTSSTRQNKYPSNIPEEPPPPYSETTPPKYDDTGI